MTTGAPATLVGAPLFRRVTGNDYPGFIGGGAGGNADAEVAFRRPSRVQPDLRLTASLDPPPEHLDPLDRPSTVAGHVASLRHIEDGLRLRVRPDVAGLLDTAGQPGPVTGRSTEPPTQPRGVALHRAN